MARRSKQKGWHAETGCSSIPNCIMPKPGKEFEEIKKGPGPFPPSFTIMGAWYIRSPSFFVSVNGSSICRTAVGSPWMACWCGYESERSWCCSAFLGRHRCGGVMAVVLWASFPSRLGRSKWQSLAVSGIREWMDSRRCWSSSGVQGRWVWVLIGGFWWWLVVRWPFGCCLFALGFRAAAVWMMVLC